METMEPVIENRAPREMNLYRVEWFDPIDWSWKSVLAVGSSESDVLSHMEEIDRRYYSGDRTCHHIRCDSRGYRFQKLNSGKTMLVGEPINKDGTSVGDDVVLFPTVLQTVLKCIFQYGEASIDNVCLALSPVPEKTVRAAIRDAISEGFVRRDGETLKIGEPLGMGDGELLERILHS